MKSMEKRKNKKPLSLPKSLEKKMSRSFHADFSNVTMVESPEVSKVGARALSSGSMVAFGSGEFSPHTTKGQELIGHELSHVMQQAAGEVTQNQWKEGPEARLNKNRYLEYKADLEGGKAAKGMEVNHSLDYTKIPAMSPDLSPIQGKFAPFSKGKSSKKKQDPAAAERIRLERQKAEGEFYDYEKAIRDGSALDMIGSQKEMEGVAGKLNGVYKQEEMKGKVLWGNRINFISGNSPEMLKSRKRTGEFFNKMNYSGVGGMRRDIVAFTGLGDKADDDLLESLYGSMTKLEDVGGTQDLQTGIEGGFEMVGPFLKSVDLIRDKVDAQPIFKEDWDTEDAAMAAAFRAKQLFYAVQPAGLAGRAIIKSPAFKMMDHATRQLLLEETAYIVTVSRLFSILITLWNKIEAGNEKDAEKTKSTCFPAGEVNFAGFFKKQRAEVIASISP